MRRHSQFGLFVVLFGVGTLVGIKFFALIFDFGDSPRNLAVDHSDPHFPAVSTEKEAPLKPTPATNDFVATDSLELFRTTIDQSGKYVSVNPERSVVTLRDKNENVLWSTNVIEGLKSEPFPGGRQIFDLKVDSNDIWIGLGREWVSFDIGTGQMLYQGNN